MSHVGFFNPEMTVLPRNHIEENSSSSWPWNTYLFNGANGYDINFKRLYELLILSDKFSSSQESKMNQEKDVSEC